MRIYDKLVAHADIQSRWYEDLRNANLVVVDNVAEFYMAGDKCWNISRDFPNVAPPFSSVVYEGRIPRTQGRSSSEFFAEHGAARFCTLVVAEARQDKAGWFLKIFVFVDRFGVMPDGPLVSFRLAVKQDGTPDPSLDEWPYSIAFEGYSMNEKLRVLEFDEHLVGELHQMFQPFVYVALLASCFLHCKNVDLVSVEPDKKLAKRTFERYGIPMHTFKVLTIDPMVKRLRGHMATGLSLQRSMHICRGHFRDYRERGLFGKLKGRYWFPQHIRGDAEVGVIEKAYKVNPGIL